MHNKNIEAFCQEDSRLVCINCILSNEHKGHTLHAIDKAIDIQITHIGKEFEKSKEIKNNIIKQKNEINDKLQGVLDSCISKKQDIAEFFADVRKIIDDREEKLTHEVDDKFESTNALFTKRIEIFASQEQAIEELEDMMNIHIDDDMTSQLRFLQESGLRNDVIDKISKNMTAIKYPAPLVKLRQDRELDTIIKELKQKPKAKSTKARKASVQSKQTAATPSNRKLNDPPPDSFSKSLKSSSTKIHSEKKSTKTPQVQKKKVEDIPKVESSKNSHNFKGSSAKKHLEALNKRHSEKVPPRQPPKVIQDALNKAQCEDADSDLAMMSEKSHKTESRTNPPAAKHNLKGMRTGKIVETNPRNMKTQNINTPQKKLTKQFSKDEEAQHAVTNRDRQHYVSCSTHM